MWIVAAFIAVVILFPVYWIFLSSVTPRDELFTTPIHYIPLHPSLENYVNLFKAVNVPWLAGNTAAITAVSLVLSIVLALIAAYAFSRIRFRGSKIAMGFLIASAMLPATSTVVPLFQFFRTLHLTDTFGGIVILYTSSFVPFTTLIFTTFFQQIPQQLEEAAFIDGAGLGRTLVSVIMPVMKPAIATMAIIIFILSMNEFLLPLIFATQKLKTLSLGITEIPRMSQYHTPWDEMSALGTLMLLPIVIFVIAFEKNIMQGLMAGSVKG
jgi:ABC-type glycerol-3-phosphate transport system permease component